MQSMKILLFTLLLSFNSLAQYEQYIPLIEPYLSAPIESGFFHFNVPNNIQVGQLYQWYKITAPDLENDMILTKVHTDSAMGMTHYKYQQYYRGLKIEAAGCIEHYQSDGSLNMLNAKIADTIGKSEVPTISADDAIRKVLDELRRDPNVKFAWEHDDWEESAKIDSGDSTASYYPSPELLWAIDSVYALGLIIPGSRYTLCYKFTVKTISPLINTTLYYVNANTGEIFKKRENHQADGPADIFGYGVQTVDTKWYGGFTYSWVLHANNGTRDIHTRKETNGQPTNYGNWNSPAFTFGFSNVTDNNDYWIGKSSQTSPHYFATQAWDYYYQEYGRAGYNWNGLQCQIRTEWNSEGAHFLNPIYQNSTMIELPSLAFGKKILNGNSYDLGWDPSIVGHEYTHGIVHFTANLIYEFESGALNESFCDIFGIVIHAQMLDGGTTDWTLGNSIPQALIDTRRLDFPKLAGKSWTGQIINNIPSLQLGQPDTYLGENYCDNCPLMIDNGGIHFNSGVQNKWFYLLANGGSGVNDNGEAYNVVGIGMEKAARIAYFNLTAVLLEGAQYTDAREGSVWEALIIYGECSIEHQSTINAWHAVGIGNPTDCSFILNNPDEETELDVSIFPNPTTSSINIKSSTQLAEPVYIFDTNGKIVDVFDLEGLNGSRDLSSLANGVYFIKFVTNYSNRVERIVINK